MEIRAENVNPAEIVSFEQNYSYSQPMAGIDGASFPAMPRLRHFAITGGIAFGTTSIGSQPPDLSAFEHCTIAVRVVPHDASVTLAEQYSRLREEIVASGTPMLSDEELRNEIRERRGARTGTED